MKLEFLREQNVSESLLKDIDNFRKQYPVEEKMRVRIPNPPIPFYGKELLEMSIAALLKGENLLLSGGKATGKNILAENLAYIFGRPSAKIFFPVAFPPERSRFSPFNNAAMDISNSSLP